MNSMRVARPFLALVLTSVCFGAGVVEARPPGQADAPAVQFQPVPPPPPMPRQRRLHWVTDSDQNAPQRTPRMSPDERRELRREIHDAGREIYPRPQRRRDDD